VTGYSKKYWETNTQKWSDLFGFFKTKGYFDTSYNHDSALLYYGIKDEDAELHCSGNAGNEELIQRYDNLILVYIEPVRLSHF
jgi:hypothetical protein